MFLKLHCCANFICLKENFNIYTKSEYTHNFQEHTLSPVSTFKSTQDHYPGPPKDKEEFVINLSGP